MIDLSRKMFARFIFAGLLVTSVAMSVNAAEYMTPEFARAEFRPATMFLIPPRAEVIKKKIAGSEQMIEESSALEDATSQLLQDRFGELGYQVRTLAVDELNADPELQLMVRNFNERYDTDIVQVYKKPKDVRKRRFSFGDEARILAARLNADVLVVSRVQASGATGGQKTMAFLFGGSKGHAALNVGIVAGDNGDLEGFFTDYKRGLSPQKISEEPVETMARVSAKVLKKYPAVGEVLAVRTSWPQSTNRQVPDAGLSDEELFTDLEALIGAESENPAEDAGRNVEAVQTEEKASRE